MLSLSKHRVGFFNELLTVDRLRSKVKGMPVATCGSCKFGPATLSPLRAGNFVLNLVGCFRTAPGWRC
jgi:hypothetical protein